LTAPAFKTALDGTTLFFPWGFLGRGYPIKSELDYRRLRQQLKINYVLGFVLFICAFALLGYAELVLATVALVLVYLVWVGFRLRGAQPSDEKLSYQEAIAAQTSKISPKLLWSLEIGSIIFVIGGMFILVSEPDQWLKAAGEIFFFGVCSIAYANMLLIQKKASRMRVSQQTAGSHLSRRRAPNQAYDHADQVGLSTMNTDMHEPPVQPPPISAVNSAKMAIPAKTARLLIFLLLGFGVWAYLGFPSPDTLLYWPSAKEECVKFAGKHRELFDPGKSIRAVSSWMKHGKVVVEIGAFNDSDESYRPRICVVGGGTIEIVSLLETGAWR
jgi:hypothetical protein